MLFLASSVQAPAQISFHVTVGSPPEWGPAGYSDVRYYYLPDVEAYYDVQTSMFIYFEGRSWVRRENLPHRYRNYDLYEGYKVVVTDYRGNYPQKDFRTHRRHYARGYRGHAQRNIGHRPGKGNNHYDGKPGNQHNDGNTHYERRPGNQHNNNKNHYNKPRNNNNHGNGKNDGRGKGNDHENKDNGNNTRRR